MMTTSMHTGPRVFGGKVIDGNIRTLDPIDNKMQWNLNQIIRSTAPTEDSLKKFRAETIQVVNEAVEFLTGIYCNTISETLKNSSFSQGAKLLAVSQTIHSPTGQGEDIPLITAAFLALKPTSVESSMYIKGPERGVSSQFCTNEILEQDVISNASNAICNEVFKVSKLEAERIGQAIFQRFSRQEITFEAALDEAADARVTPTIKYYDYDILVKLFGKNSDSNTAPGPLLPFLANRFNASNESKVLTMLLAEQGRVDDAVALIGTYEYSVIVDSHQSY